MTEKNNIPQIRFKGFMAKWGIGKLIDYSSRVGDGLHGTPEYVDASGIYFINGNNLNLGSIILTKETKQVSKNDYLGNDKKLDFDTILMAINGTIGNLALYQGENVMLGKSVAYIVLKDCDRFYAYFYLQTTKVNNYFFDNLTGSTIKNLGLKTIRETELSIPIPEEQKKIGEYFQQLDKLIEQKEQKYQKLQQLKKSMLAKMFPTNGADIPSVRFKGFTDNWIKTELGKYSKFRRGSFPQPYGKKEWYDGYGAMPFVQVVDVNSNLSLVNNTKQKISLLAQPRSVLVKKGTVVVTLQGSIGRVAILQYDAYVDRTLLIFEYFENETNIDYWAYLIQEVFNIEKKKAPGGTIKTITKESLSKFSILIPVIEEQTKIGGYFHKLDQLIDLQQQELEKLKNLKKAFLAKMFV